MKYRTIIIIALVLAAALVVIFGWRPTSAAVAKIYYGVAARSGLIGYWNFDDCDTCTTANDMSGNGNTGTMYNAAGPTVGDLHTPDGRVNRGAFFDGTNDYVDGGNFSDNPTNLSVSLWLRSTDDNGYILTKANDTSSAPGWSVILSGGKIEFLIAQNGSNYKYILTDGTYNDNKWHHLAATKDASNNIALYLDGSSVSSAVSAGTVTTTSNAINVRVGVIGNGTFFYAGYVDEIRIYNRALSVGEIKHLYESGLGTKVVTKSPNKTGLVGFWNFDDADSGTNVADRSGNGNDGTMYTTCATVAGDLHTTSGKNGNGATLDGTNDCMSLGDPASLELSAGTVSLWFKPAIDYDSSIADTAVGLWDKGDTYIGAHFQHTTGKLRFAIFDGSSHIALTNQALWKAGTWYHAAFLWGPGGMKIYINGILDGTDSHTGGYSNVSDSWVIGQKATKYFNGQIDEVRIYNRALSAAEVKGLFEETKRVFVNMPQNKQLTDGLVGMWSFNGPDINWAQSSAEARDTSGNGNHGDVTNFGQEAAIPGIVGQALSFDGSDDRVTLTNAITGNDYSYSAWVKLRALPTSGNAMVIFNSGNVANGDQNLWLLNNVSALNGWALSSYSDVSADTASEGSLTAQIETWYFIVGVRNSSDDSARVYVNGSQVAIDSNLTSPTALYGSVGVSTNIGMRVGGTNFFNGLIDEVRVYNRALSAAEVTRLYNAGRRE